LIERYLEELDSFIDVSKVREAENLQIRSCRYEDVERLPIALCTFDDMSKERYPTFTKWPVFSYGEIFRDKEKMLLDELLPIYEGVLAGDDRTKVIRANYGVGILPSVFGLEIIQKDDEMPWVKPVSSIEEVKKIVKRGVPEIKSGLIEKVNETNEYYKEKISHYPNLKDTIHIGLPDPLGIFNLAGVIMGEELYISIYEHRDVIKDLLELCTQTYIKYAEVQKKLVGEPMETGYYFACTLPSGVKISEDYGLAVSPDKYEEFCIPYNEIVAKRFNGITLVICEDIESKMLKKILDTKGLKGLIYWSKDFKKLEEAYELAKESKICIIWYGNIPANRKSDFPTGIILKQRIRSLRDAEIIKQ